jgi:hypothetical protein
VENRGPDTVTSVSLEVKVASGWSASIGTVRLGDIGSGSQRTFSVQALVGPPTVSAITFVARSSSHIALEFPVSVLVASRIAPEVIQKPGEAKDRLMDIVSQWGVYSVWRIGDLLFPDTSQGITSGEGLQQILKGYFVEDFLRNHPDLASVASSLADQFSGVASDTNSLQDLAYRTYDFSVSFSIYKVTYTTSLYSFLTWTIPFSEWTAGIVQDRSVADLIAWAVREYSGLDVSARDIIQLADYFARGSQVADPVASYVPDLQDLSRLLLRIASAGVPELDSLIALLHSSGHAVGVLASAANVVNELVNAVQSIASWIRQLLQQLHNIFQSLVNWISAHIPLVADAINNAIIWLYNALSSAISYVISIIDSATRTQSTTQTAKSTLSDMSGTVDRSSNNAWSGLSARLEEIAGETKHDFDSFCTEYSPAISQVKGLTTWLYRAATTVSAMAPETGAPAILPWIAGALLIENGVGVACSVSLTGKVDAIQVISSGIAATALLTDIFPAEEKQFNMIGGVLNGIAAAVTVYYELQDPTESTFDLKEVSGIVTRYQSASSNGLAKYQLATPDYANALGAIVSISDLPNINAINELLKSLQPFSQTIDKFVSYTQEGMVAPDLQSQVQELQEKGQDLISRITRGDYTVLAEAATIATLYTQLSQDVDARHQQFLEARSVLDGLSAALAQLHGCGFLWVQPDSAQVDEMDKALQLAQSGFSGGHYANAINSASRYVDQASKASQSCSASATSAKLQVGFIGILSVIGVAFAINRTRKGKSDRRDRRIATIEPAPAPTISSESPDTIAVKNILPPEEQSPQTEVTELGAPIPRTEPKVEIAVESSKPMETKVIEQAKPIEPKAQVVSIQAATTKIVKEKATRQRIRKPSAAKPRKKRRPTALARKGDKAKGRATRSGKTATNLSKGAQKSDRTLPQKAMPVRHCDSCGNVVSNEDSFCQNCGAPLH